jgi:5'-nucleotidase
MPTKEALVRLGAALVAAALTLSAATSLGACGGDDTGGAADPSPAPDADAGGGGDDAAASVRVRILAINDFHGNLEAPSGANAYVLAHASDPALENAGPTVKVAAGTVAVKTGGAAVLAAHVKALRAEVPNSVLVSAGDLSGASPLVSNIFPDEPSVLVMNALGLDFNGVGNHEFDHGPAELLRLQNGGCHPVDGCVAGQPAFPGAKFHYLAANVDDAKKQTLFRPYEIKTFDGEKIAFVGMTLEQTKSVVPASAVKDLTFLGEVATINALVPEIKAQGVAAIVLLLHQGDIPAEGTTYDGCGIKGGFLDDLVSEMDPAVGIVVSAHTHQPYVCELGKRLVTSASSYGRVVTQIDLEIDHATHTVSTRTAKNVPVTSARKPDTDIASILATYTTLSAPLANKVIGHLTGDLAIVASAAGEMPIGDVIADAQLEATKASGAVVAFMNPGGVRADIPFAPAGTEQPGEVTYKKAFAVQPFSNQLVVMDLTGADIVDLLEQQFGASGVRILQVSSGFQYSFSATPVGGKYVDAATIKIAGAALVPSATYRVTVNDFVAGGGDDFTVPARGKNVVRSAIDLDAFVAYFGAHDPLTPPTTPRITRK